MVSAVTTWKLRSLSTADQTRCREIARWRRELAGEDVQEKLRLRRASMGAAAGRMMTRLVQWKKPTRIFEIGTCAGIGAAYMCSAAETVQPAVHYTGMEGNAEKIARARRTLAKFCPRTTVDIHEGLFAETFEAALEAARPLQLVYLDGWHRPEPTLRMFRACVAAMEPAGVVVCDDLNLWKLRGVREQLKACERVQTWSRFAGKDAFFIQGG